MAAAVTVSPTDVQVGDAVTITATGFLPDTDLKITIPEHGVEAEIKSDKSGAASGVDLPDKAFGTLTSDGTIPTAADTVTVDGVVYTFRASVTTTANEVLLGANAAASLTNLKSAINLDGTPGVYGSLTVVHPTVGAGALTATTLVLYAKTGGTGGNSLATTEASTHLSFGGGTLASGAAATGTDSLVYKPATPGPLNVSVTDGTSTATARVLVYTE